MSTIFCFLEEKKLKNDIEMTQKHTHHFKTSKKHDEEVHSETKLSDMSQGKSTDCDILHYDSVEIHAKMNKIWYNPRAHLTPFQLVVSVYLPVSLTSCNSDQPVPTTGLFL